MNKHLQYLRYVIRHKWFVLLASIRIGVPLWRAVFHDLSKFLPSEWFPYAEYFYGGDHKPYSSFPSGLKYQLDCWKNSKEGVKQAFDFAWLKYQHRNPHHWQYWLLREDSGGTITLMMPEKYRLEMIADWIGAGRAITGKLEVNDWYNKNKDKIKLHPQTREFVELALEDLK